MSDLSRAWAKQNSEAWDMFHRKMEALTAESLNGLHRHLSQEDGGFDC